MNKEKRKQEGGITLVALVITIIVLLILASVTITILIGENSIIEKTQQGADDWSQAEQDEREELNSLSEYLNEVTNKLPGEIEEP